MKRLLKYLGWTVAMLVILAIVAFVIARSMAMNAYNKTWTAHADSFPIPFPLSDGDVASLRAARAGAADAGAAHTGATRVRAGAPAADPLAGVDLTAEAKARAITRGKHLVDSRFGCAGCHGADFGGQVIIDSPIVGRWAAPNLTSGEGGVTRGFTPHDWDLAVRHGIRHTGQSSSMPSTEFITMSDHELSDVVSYVMSMPPVNKSSPPLSLGPVFAFLVAFDASMLPAAAIDHQKAHQVEPPPAAPSTEFGQHIAQVCRGCHGDHLSGGKMDGDPNMPIVANLTPHETGLKDWTEADFIRALRDGKRKDGTAINVAMPWQAYGQMTDVELKAVWAYLRTVPAVEKGNH